MGNNQDNRRTYLETDKLQVGFQNKSMTLCYANSVLQVLLHHPVFVDIIANSPLQKGLVGEMKALYKGMKAKKQKSVISTLKLMSYIQKQSGIFDQDHHQDCHEFYIWLMNRINDQIKGKSKERTKLQEQFFSERVTRTQCQNCKKNSEREQQEVDMSLILPEPNVSLNYCLDNYSNGEVLQGRDKFKCDNCEDLQNATKKTLIKTLPNFLSVHLRRFKYDETRKGITKLMWLIPFPFKIKIKTNHDTANSKEMLYKLVGVVAHIGNGGNYGHYISYIKINKQWFLFNDDEIKEVQDYMLQSLWGYKGLTKCAYMLFYTI